MKDPFGKLVPILLLSLLLTSCSGAEEEDDEPMKVDGVQKEEEKLDTLKQPKAFVLPTPTQVPTLLEDDLSNYRPEFLLKVDSLPSSMDRRGKALWMGALLIDATYSGFNDDPARVKKFLHQVRGFAKDLYLGSFIERKKVKKLQDLADRKDKLADELLAFYRDVHRKFREEGKKELGFYMVRGAFLEGLYLSVRFREDLPQLSRSRIMEQQKHYSENLQKLRSILFHGDKDDVSSEWESLHKSLREDPQRISIDRVERIRREVLLGGASGS